MDDKIDGKRLSDDALTIKAEEFSRSLISKASKPVALANHALSLLEHFKYESNKLDRIGYCDTSLAFVCFKSSIMLLNACERLAVKSLYGFIENLKTYSRSLRDKFAKIESILRVGTQAPDGLLSRLASLKSGSNDHIHTRAEYFKQRNFILPAELNAFIRNKEASVLLIDFRGKREFTYSHINYSPIMNIDPVLVKQLSEDESLDCDLEDLLERSGSESIALFRERHKFDLIVIYNTKFGSSYDDKFEALKSNLLADDKKNSLPQNPFRSIIALISFKTKYLSSRSKQFPLILNGGIERWYNRFGDASLTRGHSTHTSSPAEIVEASKYLKKFDDYLKCGRSPSKLSEGVLFTSNSGYEPKQSPNASTSKTSRRDKKSEPSVLASARDEKSEPHGLESKISKAKGDQLSESKGAVLNDSVSASSSPPQDIQEEPLLKSCSTGLTNLGNSCYMNCILQCLIATPQLVSFLLPPSSSSPTAYKQHINMKNSLGSQGRITTAFANLIFNMFAHDGSYITPTTFKSIIGKLSPGQQFLTSEQQDCIEFLNFILDGLHEDLNQRQINHPAERAAIAELSPEQEKAREVLPVRLASTIEWERYLKLNFSVIVDFFQGQYSSQLRCLECRMTSTTYNSFSTLSLPIPEKLSASSSSPSLTECLDLFVETELLDHDNKWHCPKCKRFTRSTKKMTITRLPKVLIIHFKRFKIQAGKFRKLEHLITYPVNDDLDLNAYWPPIGSYLTEQPEPFISTQKEQELLGSMPDRNQRPPFKYRLYGVVNHFGNLTTGHYTSYIKKTNAGNGISTWSYFNDAKISRNCKESDVLNPNAYCLFFERV